MFRGNCIVILDLSRFCCMFSSSSLHDCSWVTLEVSSCCSWLTFNSRASRLLICQTSIKFIPRSIQCKLLHLIWKLFKLFIYENKLSKISHCYIETNSFRLFLSLRKTIKYKSNCIYFSCFFLWRHQPVFYRRMNSVNRTLCLLHCPQYNVDSEHSINNIVQSRWYITGHRT